ncbi:MAG: toll/interleukin-1 receptor domain-containing protein [Lachnospiraceae bacterium]|nr:toll/interleukin-1 receptor domain-containing protein [Lachnospiraceae bacterium]
MRTPKIAHPKVFISYAWTSDIYTNKVASFAAELQNIGIEVLFDKFETKPGNELNYFMERCVNDETVTNVLLLLNKTYKEKADKRECGVGKETQIISKDIYNKVTQTKFIPVILERGENGEIYKPAYLGSTYYVDLSDSKNYDEEFCLLVKTLVGETVYRKPELGSIPDWVTQEVTFPVNKQIEFNSIKQQKDSKMQKLEYKQTLDEICKKITLFCTNDIVNGSYFSKNYINKYKDTMVIRDEYLRLLTIAIYVDDSEKLIAAFLENVLNKHYDHIEQYAEIKMILLHELFIRLHIT